MNTTHAWSCDDLCEQHKKQESQSTEVMLQSGPTVGIGLSFLLVFPGWAIAGATSSTPATAHVATKMQCGSSHWRCAQRLPCDPTFALSFCVNALTNKLHLEKKLTWDLLKSFPFPPYLVNFHPFCLCSMCKQCEEKIIVPSLCLYFHKMKIKA